MRVDGKFLAVDGFPFFDGKFLAVDGNSNFDGKSPLYRDRPPVRYFHVGKFTEHLPENFGARAALRNFLQEKLRGRGGFSCRFDRLQKEVKRQKSVYRLVTAPQGGTQKNTLAFAYDSPR